MKYVKRTDTGIKVVGKNEVKKKEGLKQYLNKLCLDNLSTFEGREEASKKLLGVKSTPPIYVNNEMMLFPTESIRNNDCVYLNYHRILCILETHNGLSKVIFDDLTELYLDKSSSKIQKQLVRTECILEKIIS